MSAGVPATRPACVLLLIALAGIAACGPGTAGAVSPAPAPPSRSPSASRSPSPSTTPAPYGLAPLTGLPASSSAVAARPALVVPVTGAQPKGLGAADVVYEEISSPVRYIAVYQSRNAGEIGPVAQGRPTEPQLLGVLHPLVAYAGIRQGPARQLAASPAVDVGYPRHTTAYRASGGALYTSTARLYDAGRSAAPPEVLNFAGPGQRLATGGMKRARRVEISVPGLGTQVWTYDPGVKLWHRDDGNGPHVSVADLVVQDVRYGTVKIGKFATAPKAQVFGHGDCFVAAGDGQTARGTWTKPGPRAATNYADADGFPFRFTPGRTWIVLAPPGTHVTTR